MLDVHEPLLSFFILLLGRALPGMTVTAVTNNKINLNELPQVMDTVKVVADGLNMPTFGKDDF